MKAFWSFKRLLTLGGALAGLGCLSGCGGGGGGSNSPSSSIFGGIAAGTAVVVSGPDKGTESMTASISSNGTITIGVTEANGNSNTFSGSLSSNGDFTLTDTVPGEAPITFTGQVTQSGSNIAIAGTFSGGPGGDAGTFELTTSQPSAYVGVFSGTTTITSGPDAGQTIGVSTTVNSAGIVSIVVTTEKNGSQNTYTGTVNKNGSFSIATGNVTVTGQVKVNGNNLNLTGTYTNTNGDSATFTLALTGS